MIGYNNSMDSSCTFIFSVSAELRAGPSDMSGQAPYTKGNEIRRKKDKGSGVSTRTEQRLGLFDSWMYCPHLTCLRARGEGDEGEDSPPQTIRHRCPGNGATSHLRTFAREYLVVESCDFTSAPQICIIKF
ncbi:hypothetical protein J6590_024066 [Homalodisca vitripennis]|nr:hypothetical protein J6590_024066 [Homalodisca vitripennis]